MAEKADIFEEYDEEADECGFIIVYDDETTTGQIGPLTVTDRSLRRDKRVYKRRCDAGRVARKNAKEVNHWYSF